MSPKKVPVWISSRLRRALSPQPGFSKSYLKIQRYWETKTTEHSQRDYFLGHPVYCESRNISDLNILGLRFFTDPGGGWCLSVGWSLSEVAHKEDIWGGEGGEGGAGSVPLPRLDHRLHVGFPRKYAVHWKLLRDFLLFARGGRGGDVD